MKSISIVFVLFVVVSMAYVVPLSMLRMMMKMTEKVLGK